MPSDSQIKIALKRLRRIALPLSVDGAETLNREESRVVLAEAARLGFQIKNPELLQSADRGFLDRYPRIIEAMLEMRGGRVEYVPLFLNFPTDLPNDEDLFARRIYGYLGNLLDFFPEEECTVLDNGRKIPHWLFDLEKYGADPIYQTQDGGLFDRALEQLAGRGEDSHVEWIELALIDDQQLGPALQSWLLDNLYSRSSIPANRGSEIADLLLDFGDEAIDVDEIKIHETKTHVLDTYWTVGDYDRLPRLVRSPTDLLRLFASLTNGDVSLATSVRFPKMNRAQRRTVLGLLEGCADLEEDLWRRRGLWLQIGRYLHPGEYASRFPETAAAFDRLRNGRWASYDAQTEALLDQGDLDGVLKHLAHRPGLFARRLHELLRRFDDREAVLSAFRRVAARVPLKTLLTLRSHLGTINDLDYRTVINKKGLLKVVVNNSKRALADDVVQRAVEALESAMLRQIGAKETWEGRKVWIDPDLRHFTVPLQQRSASDGVLTYGRGTQIPLRLDKVLRLFVYWKQNGVRTDLDLSVVRFDADFNYLGHVSYTRLSSDGIAHSGDLQSAPRGAAEFVDITLKKLPKTTRYVASMIFCYSGEKFADCERCHAGWMIRGKVDLDVKTFDIKTVAHKFDLQGRSAYCIPLVIDLQEERAILTDLYMSGRESRNNIEGAQTSVSIACRAIQNFLHTRPTMHDLAEFHVRARGAELAASREEADLSFGVRDCTWNAGEPEKILSQLL